MSLLRLVTHAALITSPLIVHVSGAIEAAPLAFSHDDSEHVVRFTQDPQRSLALLHDHEALVTELSSLAGGCRIKLHWETKSPLSFSKFKVISGSQPLRAALERAGLGETKGGAGRLTLKAQRALSLRGAYSAGCALPDLKWARLKPTRARPLLHKREPRAPWRALTLSLDQRSGDLSLSDEGFIIHIKQRRGRVTQVTQDDAGVHWRSSKLALNLSVISAHSPLTPLPSEALKLSPTASGASALQGASICARPAANRPIKLPCQALRALLAFLSYQEGVYEGLGEGVGARGAPALLGVSLLSDYLPISWTKAALGAALDDGLKWPLNYNQALRPLDGRFAATPLLARLLTRLGPSKATQFLKSKRGWRMWGSMFTGHLRGLMRLASHFANRPSHRYLLRVAPPQRPQEERLDLISNLTLMPWALSASVELLKEERYAALLGARPGEAKRLTLLLKAWRRTAHLFEGRVALSEARRRGAQWSSRVLEAPTEEPWQELLDDLSVLYHQLAPPAAQARASSSDGQSSAAPDPLLSATSYLEGLLGAPDEERLKQLLSLSLPYPIGLMSPYGLALENPLILKPFSERAELPPTRHPLWLDALYQRALSAQRQRAWPTPLSSKLQARQLEHWAQLSGRRSYPLERIALRDPQPSDRAAPPSPTHEEISRRGWHLLSCLTLTLSSPPSPAQSRAPSAHELAPSAPH